MNLERSINFDKHESILDSIILATRFARIIRIMLSDLYE